MRGLVKHRGCRRHVLLNRPLLNGECARDFAVTVSATLHDKHLARSRAYGTEQVRYPIEFLLGGERALRTGCRVDQQPHSVDPVDVREWEMRRAVAMKAVDVQINHDAAEQGACIPNGCGLLVREQSQVSFLDHIPGILKREASPATAKRHEAQVIPRQAVHPAKTLRVTSAAPSCRPLAGWR